MQATLHSVSETDGKVRASAESPGWRGIVKR